MSRGSGGYTPHTSRVARPAGVARASTPQPWSWLQSVIDRWRLSKSDDVTSGHRQLLVTDWLCAITLRRWVRSRTHKMTISVVFYCAIHQHADVCNRSPVCVPSIVCGALWNVPPVWLQCHRMLSQPCSAEDNRSSLRLIFSNFLIIRDALNESNQPSPISIHLWVSTLSKFASGCVMILFENRKTRQEFASW